MTEQRTTKAPIEDVLLYTAKELTDAAYDRFTQGEISQTQLMEFYDALQRWSALSERVLEMMDKMGIEI